MNASINLIKKNVDDCISRGCSSYTFAAIYEPDYIDNLFRYFMEKGFKVGYSSTNSRKRVLVKISW